MSPEWNKSRSGVAMAARAFLSYTCRMLRIDNLSKRYGDHIVFQGLTHAFAPGCVALCEEDSTGKSSLLGIIAGALGFAGIGGAAIGVAKFLFWAGIIIAVILFVLGMTVAKKVT